MAVQYSEIQELLRSRADLNARLNLMPYDGTPEIKKRGDGQYLYVRKRVAGKLTSTYVGAYTEELYNLLLRNAREAREIRRSLRSIEKQLAAAGYSEDDLSADVINNIAFARANMKMNIYDQAVLEGVATSFPQTEEIIENGKVSGMTATDVQKILNLKHAWEFILDRDVVASRSDYYMLSHIARLVNEGFFAEGGRIRGVPVTIVKSKAMACTGLQCRFACKQRLLELCFFLFSFLISPAAAKAVLDFTGQLVSLDIPSLPPSVFSFENVFTFLRCLNPPIFIVRSDTIYFSK